MGKLNEFERRVNIDKIVELGMKGRKKKFSTFKKTSLSLAASIVLTLPILGLSFPALASHLPLIGDFFRRVEQFESFAEFASVIDSRVAVNDISFTLNEAIFDGRSVLMTYHVQSETPIRDVNLEHQFTDYLLNIYQFDTAFELIIDDEIIPTGLSVHMRNQPDLHWIDNYSFFFIYQIPLLVGDSPRLARLIEEGEVIEIRLTFADLKILNPEAGVYDNDIFSAYRFGYDSIESGPWHFQLPIVQSERINVLVDKQLHQYHHVNAEETNIWDWATVGIHTISTTPDQLIIDYVQRAALNQLFIPTGEDRVVRYDWQINDFITRLIEIQWHVTDDTGNELTELSRHFTDYGGSFIRGNIHLDSSNVANAPIHITATLMEWDVHISPSVIRKGELSSTINLGSFTIEIP